MAGFSTRECALCSVVIRDNYIVCPAHMKDYREFKDEEWFKMLVMSQRKMFEQDSVEEILKSGRIKITKPYQKLTESEKAAIRFLRSKKLSVRSIGKVLGIYHQTAYKYLYPSYTKKP